MWVNNDQYLQQLNIGDAVATQGVQLVSRLLDLKPHEIDEPGAGGITPLHRACGRGSPELVQLLLSRGADVEKKTDAGETPIHHACKRGNSLVIDALIKAGAKVDVVDNSGKTILHQVAQGGSVYALLFLESAAPQLDMNQCDNSGRSLLHYACSLGHRDIIRYLLRRPRCSIDLVDDKGNTCMHVIASTTHDDIAWYLVTNGGFKLLSMQNKDGETPMAIAERHLKTDMRYRGMRGFFRICNIINSPKQLIQQSLFIRFFLLVGPFLVYAIAIYISRYLYPKWSTFIYAVSIFVGLTLVKMQAHRTMDPARKPNPIFLGAYTAGIVHSLLCFYVDLMPYVRHTWMPKVAMGLMPIHLLVFISLLVGDPGSASFGEDAAGSQVSESYSEVLRRGGLSIREGILPKDVYCPYCEKAMESKTIKHCKLCRRCFYDLDHHCLFLMTCIARRNHRRFIWLIILTVLGICIFLYSVYIKLRMTCGLSQTAVTLFACVVERAPWTGTAAMFNGFSLIWGLYMMIYSFRAISEGGTAYFRVMKSKRPSYLVATLNVICFLFLGRWYRRSDDVEGCGHGHSHGV